MIIRNTFIIGLLAAGLFSCAGKAESTEKEPVGVSDESGQESDEEEVVEEEKAPEVISFDQKSAFSVTTKKGEYNDVTGTNTADIFVNSSKLKSAIKLTNELNYFKVEPGTNGVPKDAAFAFNTWFAGGGAVYYGIVKNGILQINRKFEDEAMEEDGKFTIFREIDPNVQTKNPGYYISYDSDGKKSKELMIAFTQDGKALFAKYYGQPRQLALNYVKETSEGRNIVEYYDEVVNGEVNGTYKLTHSGNWDYAEYTVKKTGKKFNFTINHNVTIQGDTYRTDPSL